MKRIIVLFGLIGSGSLLLFAGPCSSTMSMTALIGTGSIGCDFNGYNFNNFALTQYIDAATTASNGYNFLVHNTPGDDARDNYLATFTAAGASSFQIAFTGKVMQTDGTGAWTINTSNAQDSSSNLGFTIVYNINSVVGGNDVNGLHNASATLAGVTYNGPAAADASTSLIKQLEFGGTTQLVNDKLIAAGGTQTKQMSLNGNNTGTIKVTDTFIEQISNLPLIVLTTSTLINSFDAPEPVTLGLIGAGLACLGLLRRRLH